MSKVDRATRLRRYKMRLAAQTASLHGLVDDLEALAALPEGIRAARVARYVEEATNPYAAIHEAHSGKPPELVHLREVLKGLRDHG